MATVVALANVISVLSPPIITPLAPAVTVPFKVVVPGKTHLPLVKAAAPVIVTAPVKLNEQVVAAVLTVSEVTAPVIVPMVALPVLVAV